MTTAELSGSRERPETIRRVVLGLGLSVTLLGAAVLLGWYTGNTRLMQVAPAFVPMQYNTALGFLIAGLGVVALTRGRGRPAAALGGAVGVLGLATLLQYLTGLEFGIDELLMEHYVTIQTSHPGRMAPNTALCFALFGGSLVVIHRAPPRSALRAFSVLGSLVFSLGTIAFLGYLAGVETVYGWGQLTRMAVHTAVGFQLLGAALGVHAWAVSPAHDESSVGDRTWTVLVPVATVLLSLAVGMWQGLRAAEDLRIRRDVGQEASRIAAVIRNDVALRIPSLRRMGDRWEIRGGTPEAEWREDARRYIADEAGYEAIAWVDGDNRVRWVESRDGAQVAVGFDLGSEPRRRQTLETARRNGAASASAPVDLLGGGRGLLVAIPIRGAAGTQGFTLGVFRFEALLDSILADEPAGYGLAVEDAGEELYRRGNGDDAAFPAAAEAEISVYGRTWRVHTWPMPGLVASERTLLPWIVLVFLGSFAFLVPVILHSTRRAQIASARLELTSEALAREVSKLDDVIAACPNGIVIVNEEGTITMTNHEARRLFGYEDAELVGQSIEILLPEGARPAHRDHRNEFLQRPVARPMSERDEVLLGKRRDGTEFPIEIGLAPIHSPGGVHVVSAVADITGRVAAEREAAERTEELVRSNAELEQFAYVAAHDLQEPLRMVASYTELLGQRYEGQLDDKADKFIGYAVDGARRMQDLLSDLLTYSRVGTRRGPREEIDSGEALGLALANLEVAIRESDGEVAAEGLPRVLADPGQLTQLFQNLVANSLKFRRDDVPPRIQIRADTTSDHWIFRVQDNGIGIDKDYFERVFRVFQRLHPRGRYDGSGIGLAIAKKIAEQHGGRLWVESEEGKGSTFSFSLSRNPNLAGEVDSCALPSRSCWSRTTRPTSISRRRA